MPKGHTMPKVTLTAFPYMVASTCSHVESDLRWEATVAANPTGVKLFQLKQTPFSHRLGNHFIAADNDSHTV